MTITARQTRTRLTATLTLIAKLDALPLAVAEIHRAIDLGLLGDDGRTAAEDAGIRSKGGHSDPTADQAISRATHHERLLDDVEANLATLALAAGNLSDTISRWVMSAANAEEHPRCTGGSSVDPWTRPDCTELAMHNRRDDGSYSYHRDGLCWGCYQRRRRWIEEQADMAS